MMETIRQIEDGLQRLNMAQYTFACAMGFGAMFLVGIAITIILEVLK